MRLVVLSLTASALSACAGDSEAKPGVPLPNADAESVTAVVDSAARCAAVLGSALVELGENAAEPDSQATLPGPAYQVRSRDHDDMTYVSGYVQAPARPGDEIATFAYGGDELGDGLIFTVNSVAEEAFVWPYGPEVEARVTMFEDGAELSQRCVRDLASPAPAPAPSLASPPPSPSTASSPAPTPAAAPVPAPAPAPPPAPAPAPPAAPRALSSGLLCKDLKAAGRTYAQAMDYWYAEGAPDRMDADLNGIPCETVYPAAAVNAYWGLP